jgi:hypothetical protein
MTYCVTNATAGAQDDRRGWSLRRGWGRSLRHGFRRCGPWPALRSLPLGTCTSRRADDAHGFANEGPGPRTGRNHMTEGYMARRQPNTPAGYRSSSRGRSTSSRGPPCFRLGDGFPNVRIQDYTHDVSFHLSSDVRPTLIPTSRTPGFLPDDNRDDNDDSQRHTIPAGRCRPLTLGRHRAWATVGYGSEGWGFDPSGCARQKPRRTRPGAGARRRSWRDCCSTGTTRRSFPPVGATRPEPSAVLRSAVTVFGLPPPRCEVYEKLRF